MIRAARASIGLLAILLPGTGVAVQAPPIPGVVPWPRRVVVGGGSISRPPESRVVRRLDPAFVDASGEGYRLVIDTGGVVLTARTAAGLFYGGQTLEQLTTPDGRVPRVSIDDAPRFRWRGMHLDVGRHMYPVAFIKRYIDLLARYKFNTFHWHLTEDQGWRLEIERYPGLTTIGSCREETVVARNFDPYVGDGRPYCGFYTQDEVREVVRYAAERFITVVPEIEMPGHSVAALAAYPELGCGPGPYKVWTMWGVSEDIYCPSEETFTFLENVLTEVMALFPSTFIHVGGDEAPKAAWKKSVLAQEVMRREGLRSEEALQGWFIRRIDRFLTRHGRRLVGWDEILEGGLAPGATVMSWRGVDGGVVAARAGHDVVMTPTSHLYFDYYQGDARFEPLAGGGMVTLERVYGFEPVPAALTERQAKHILGAQGNVWTEYMPDSRHVEYMAVPRMLALAEVVWSPRSARRWSSFLERLPAQFEALDRLGINYRLPAVSGLEEDRLFLSDTATVTLSVPMHGMVIRYTLDGTDPEASSPRYDAPFVVPLSEAGTVVTARAFGANGKVSPPRAARLRRGMLRGAVKVDAAGLAPGLNLRYMEGKARRVADLDSMPTVRSAVASAVTIPRFARREHWGAVFTGLVRIPSDGVWTFRLSSDDGSQLWIGDELVIDADGLHSADERLGSIALKAGLHPITVRYFQAGGGRALGLKAERDGTPVALSGRFLH